MGDAISTSPTDQDENMVDNEAVQLPAVVDIALKILLHNAIEEFGRVPRDVYNGVFDLSATKKRHASIVARLDYSTLCNLVSTFSYSCELDEFSHHVVVVYPEPVIELYALDNWVMDFKSIRIASKVMELMQSEEETHLRHLYKYLHRIPESSILAGRIFKALAHRVLSDGWRSDSPLPQPIRMVSDCCDPPVFSTDPSFLSSSIPDTSLSFLAPVRDHERTRAVTPVTFTTGLSNVTLESNKYYISTSPNSLLFDSFTIDVHHDRSTVIISVFQFTTSPKHAESTQGYPFIRKIMAHVCKLHKGNFKVEVAYFLVFPKGGTQHQWQMPVGWSKNNTINDHRGDAFCIPVPV